MFNIEFMPGIGTLNPEVEAGACNFQRKPANIFLYYLSDNYGGFL
jgi:hypothetical protein